MINHWEHSRFRYRKPMPRTCKICNTELAGRADKIFCSLGCKNIYHKRLRETTKKASIDIRKYLLRNHGILQEMLDKNRTQIKVNRSDLAKKKFRFAYHTHLHTNSRNKTYHYVYDLAWMEFSNDEVLIIRKRS